MSETDLVSAMPCRVRRRAEAFHPLLGPEVHHQVDQRTGTLSTVFVRYNAQPFPGCVYLQDLNQLYAHYWWCAHILAAPRTVHSGSSCSVATPRSERCSSPSVSDGSDGSKTSPQSSIGSRSQRIVRGVVSPTEFPICFDFAQGRCIRPNCQYQHDFGAIIRHNSRERRICFDFLRGECSRGKLCRFSHNIKPLVQQWLREVAERQESGSHMGHGKLWGRGICYDFVRGQCTRGNDCPWSHNLIDIACQTAKNKETLTENELGDIRIRALHVVSGRYDPPPHMKPLSELASGQIELAKENELKNTWDALESLAALRLK